ncbi:MAG: transporter substrate-binding domain-containing protein [Clostridia bacterium]|nr:transporter substrate-binding domain-containing protein [Clostridia bacterium]
MKKKIALVLAVIIALGAILAFAGCNKQDDTNKDANTNSDLAYVQDKGTLVIGITEYAPMNYKEDGKWTGFDTEFAEAVCAELGVKAEFIVIDWDNKFPELKSKSIDCIWNGMTITDEALKNASVSDAYVKNAQVVVAKADVAAKYSSLEEMKDLRFTAESGSAGEGVIKEAGIEKYTAVLAQSDALMEVSAGSADACIIDITMANAMTGEGTSYTNLTQVCSLNEEEYGIAFRQGSDLTAKVNEIMAELKTNGKLDAIADKYELTLVK